MESTVRAWFATERFANYGGYLIGSAELIASALLLITATRRLGALLGLGIISGAIFFHLFTPLGINRTIDAAGNTDGGSAVFYGLWGLAQLRTHPLGNDKRTNILTTSIKDRADVQIPGNELEVGCSVSRDKNLDTDHALLAQTRFCRSACRLTVIARG